MCQQLLKPTTAIGVAMAWSQTKELDILTQACKPEVQSNKTKYPSRKVSFNFNFVLKMDRQKAIKSDYESSYILQEVTLLEAGNVIIDGEEAWALLPRGTDF